eukprot:scaffold264127_cov31-Tisochrysis_lutea.AAC.1
MLYHRITLQTHSTISKLIRSWSARRFPPLQPRTPLEMDGLLMDTPMSRCRPSDPTSYMGNMVLGLVGRSNRAF